MANFIIRGGNIAMPVNIKLAQRVVLTLPRSRGRDGERETGMANFIIRGGNIAMPVKRFLYLALMLLAGCASDAQRGLGGSGGSDNVALIRLGVIESVTPIELDNSSSGGASLGSIFGQVGGGSTGGGRGSVVGSVFGSVLGGTLGQQSGSATKPGLEIWVKLDEDGKSAYVMQAGKPETFKVGDRVRVLRKKGETTVEPLPAPVAAPAQP